MNHLEKATLLRMLKGNRDGYTRQQIADRLNLSDRAARQAIEDVVSSGELPIVCDRGTTGREEGRYRVARADEVEIVNTEIRELRNRALSALKRAKGLHLAYQEQHQAASLFLEDVPDPDGLRS